MKTGSPISSSPRCCPDWRHASGAHWLASVRDGPSERARRRPERRPQSGRIRHRHDRVASDTHAPNGRLRSPATASAEAHRNASHVRYPRPAIASPTVLERRVTRQRTSQTMVRVPRRVSGADEDRQLSATEVPRQRCVLLRVGPSRGAVGAHRGGVVLVGEDPHAVATRLPSEIR
jgi:hypothetical protein